MGRFLLGSTVVLLFPENTLGFHDEWEASRPVRLGEALGHPRQGRTHANFGRPDGQPG
jgi:phosphatidylserine decarboxylase